MRQLSIAICALGLFALLSGCAQPTPEERFLSHWEKIVAIVDENKTDAPKAAAAVSQYLKDNLADMKALSGQFGKNKDRKIAEDQNFIERVMRLVDRIRELEKKYQLYLDNPALNEALAPFTEITM